MNISDELARLIKAKEDLALAIVEKGGNVPTEATLDMYSELVRQIGGIVEVSELPSEDIDEKAVYKVVTQYEYTPLTVWQVITDGIVDIRSILPSGASLTTYIVNELPSTMNQSDMTVYNLHAYILEESGVCYLNIPDAGVMTLGVILTGQSGFDKGWVDDVYSIDFSNSENMGVYTTRLVYKDFIRWYIRNNYAWDEISAHIQIDGAPSPSVLQGAYEQTGTIEVTSPIATVDITRHILDNKAIPTIVVNAPSTGLLLSNGLLSVSKEFFYNPNNGTYPNYIRAGSFHNMNQLIEIELPEGITEIQDWAFMLCSALRLTELPSGLKSIGSHAFCNCYNLALIRLPETITHIYDNAFGFCYSLALTELPSTLEYIGYRAFSACTGLTTITFRNTPADVNGDIFNGCDNLTTINVPWAEDEVAGAPWGAHNATINYNYTG